MSNKSLEEYEVEDFVADESFINFHYRSNLEDEAKWIAWLQHRPDKNGLVQQARTLIETLSLSLDEVEYGIELDKIKAAITDTASIPSDYLLKPENLFEPARKKRSWVLVLPIFTALLMGGLYFFFMRNRVADRLIETVNTNAFPIILVLGDSTQVTLAPQSSLRYPAHFSSSRRDVYLKGEAGFSVKRNENAPFRVYSESIVAMVLGTVFNFKKAGDSAVVVELLKGKLGVQLEADPAPGAPIILYPNEKVVYSKSTQALVKARIESRADLAFRRSSFPEIAAAIKNAYGVTVILKGRRTNWRFTGKFKNATAKEVVENICFVENLTADVKADTLYIK